MCVFTLEFEEIDPSGYWVMSIRQSIYFGAVSFYYSFSKLISKGPSFGSLRVLFEVRLLDLCLFLSFFLSLRLLVSLKGKEPERG